MQFRRDQQSSLDRIQTASTPSRPRPVALPADDSSDVALICVGRDGWTPDVIDGRFTVARSFESLDPGPRMEGSRRQQESPARLVGNPGD
jgi:hypothetical protein